MGDIMKLKKVLALISAMIICCTLFGCNSDSSSSESEAEIETTEEITVEPTTEEPTETPTELLTEAPTVEPTEPEIVEPELKNTMSAIEIAENLANQFGGTDVMKMSYQLINAQDGASFRTGDNKFEIYMFDDESMLEDAKDGSYTISIEGFGDYQMNSFVNGNYVLLCNNVDDSVVSAFGALNLD